MRLFSKSSAASLTDDMSIFYQNYGLTVHVAQLLEKALAMLLFAAEMHGIIVIDREAKGIASTDQLLNQCFGPTIKCLEESGQINSSFRKALKRANAIRNHIIHNLIVDNSIDLANHAGREEMNERLYSAYRHLAITLDGVTRLKDMMIADIPEWQEKVNQQLKDLHDDISDSEIDFKSLINENDRTDQSS